jgi:hypothetical protein
MMMVMAPSLDDGWIDGLNPETNSRGARGKMRRRRASFQTNVISHSGFYDIRKPCMHGWAEILPAKKLPR